MGVFLSLVDLRRTGSDDIKVFEGLKAGVSNEYCSDCSSGRIKKLSKEGFI